MILKAEHNYYRILGVHEKANSHELRKAFCKLTKELHPDTTSLNHDDASLKLQIVLEAYENLHNPNLRNLHDIKLKNIEVEYWDIIDEPMVSSNISLPKCYMKVEELIRQISKELEYKKPI